VASVKKFYKKKKLGLNAPKKIEQTKIAMKYCYSIPATNEFNHV